MTSVYDTATAYLAIEVNEQCKAEIEDLISSKNEITLQKVLCSRLAFGTAGLRGPMGAGYCRMNDLVIIQTSQGLAKYLEKMFGAEAARARGVVIGYDHRRFGSLSSEGFARVSSAVFLSLGFKVYCLEGYVPTPFVAYGVLKRNCAAGIMVTASHNPKRDNGFKVYWDNGSQIIPPHDVGIASCIDDNLTPWQRYEYSDKSKILSNPLAEDVTEAIANEYFASIKSLCRHGEVGGANGSNKVSLVYTAMHGVGHAWIKRAFEIFGHAPVIAVPSQAFPDPEFSTVDFPNPEEKGALDEAMRFAASRDATLIVANDPDADRLAVAERRGQGGEWHVLSGNEIGALLGYWQIVKHRERGSGGAAAMLASVVSSRMLKKIATTEGLQYCDTLTGFKWLGNKASELKAQGVQVLLSYEEALGFCVGDVIFDKDGVSAAAVFVELVACLPQLGCSSVLGLLQQLSETYGDFVSYNSYVISHDPKVTDAIFDRIRNGGPEGSYWTQCAGQKIECIKDITRGYDSSSTDLRSAMPATPEAHMIMFEFANGCNVTLRTSGTEPKIKFYTEICSLGEKDRAAVAAELRAFVDDVVEEMLQPSKLGLARP